MAFDKVIDSAKLDGAITATANAIREKAETTEKIAWNPDTGFADAISAITVDPTKVTILREQTFAGFVVDPNFGAYSPGYVMPALFQLENGKTYYVNWDGTEYECVAYSFSYGDSTIVVIGNGSSLGLPSNNEPFLISYSATYDNSQLFSAEAKDSHTVGIWQKAAGGSSEDVRYVTFMSEDGTVELGKKAVAVGDDCADPIARGVFSTPTKDSTAQYNYTFYGWATTPNGAADSNWNKAVTEDRTVYANFVSAVRYYTVRFYDGDTLLTSKQVAYGGSTTYSPDAKDGYFFDKWEPAPENITGDLDCYAQWKMDVDFSTASWEEIAAISEAGEATKYFALGDTKTVAFGSTTITFEIAAFNLDRLADGTGYAGITVVARNLHSGKRQMNSTNTNSGGWANTAMRTYLNDTLLATAPMELQSVIKSVKKEYNTGTNNQTVKFANDKLWILSHTEIGNSNSGWNIQVGYRYSEITDSLPDVTGNYSYWLRTAVCGTTTEFVRVVKSGSNMNTTWAVASGNTGWSPQPYIRMGFCI